MAINAATNWYIRVNGNDTNGGGFDSTISGAGTNYADQDVAQLTITDGAAIQNSTTLTSITAAFTSSMIGNCITIASGTNFDTGYYFIVGFNSSSSIILDRTPASSGNASSGVGSIGGAFATINIFANGGGGPQPVLTTPLSDGHTINLRGSGLNNPLTPDYVYSGYLTFPGGSDTNGCVTLIGYNGRPFISSDGLLFFSLLDWRFIGLKLNTFSTNNGSFGIINGGACYNCIFDMNGQDMSMIINSEHVYNSAFINTGTIGVGVSPAIATGDFSATIYGNYFYDLSGYAISQANGAHVINNVIVNCQCVANGAILLTDDFGTEFCYEITNNTIDGNASDGISLLGGGTVRGVAIRGNSISNNGGFGINYITNSTPTNLLLPYFPPDYNNLWNNSSGPYNNMNPGPHDTFLPPQYKDASYQPGYNLKNKQMPFLMSMAISYQDCGAIQHMDPRELRGRRRG